MKTMIWKELRENLKWAVFGFLALLLAEIYVLSGERGNFTAYGGFTLCGSSFLMTSSFGCAVIGAAMGMVQVLPERRRDRWAALLHRPVSRGVIFFGKAIAGLALCLLATLLPLAVSVCYVAMPGNYPAPFVPGMMTPALSDLLLVGVFYFAAFLGCLHPGRWFGSKGLIALAPVPVFLIHAGSIDGVLWIPLIAAVILMLAAWGWLLANGTVQSMPRAGRWSSTVVVLVGAQIGLLVLAALAAVVHGTNSDDGYSYEKFAVTQDGQVFYYDENADGQLKDMTGKAVMDERYIGNRNYENFCPFVSLANHESELQNILRDSRSELAYAWPVRANFQDTEFWYLLVRQKYIVGYDRSSRRLIGFFDREGFKPAGEKPAPLATPAWVAPYTNRDAVLMVSGSRVYSLDLPGRRMTALLDAGNEVIEDAQQFGGQNGTANRIAVVLPHEIRVLDDAGNQLTAIPRPHDDPARWPFLTAATNKAGDRVYLISQHPNPTGHGGTAIVPNYLDEYDAHGNLLHTYSQTPGVESAGGWAERVIEYSMPLGPMLIGWFFDPRQEPFGDEWAPVLGGLAIIGAVLAAVTFLWARRTGFSTGAAARWGAFSFVFGLAGVVTFRFATDWPVRVRCPSCGKRRLIEEEHCMHCNRGWQGPERNGTEIVDSVSVAARNPL